MSARNSRRKYTSVSGMQTLKQDLFQWICQKHATTNFLDRNAVKKVAVKLSNKLSLTGFRCTEMWLSHFLRSHGFSCDLSVNTGPVFGNYRDWIDLMRSMITKYRHQDLFHADELTMYSDVSPARIASNEIDAPEKSEPSRNRITVLMGCNSTGTTKLPLLICGRYPSHITTRKYKYHRSKDSSIENYRVKSWLTAVNERMAKDNRKILLFLRRRRTSEDSELVLGNVNVVYLPEDFPPHLRPLRRDVFHYVKMIFRRRYAEHMKYCSSHWNVRDILESLSEAWYKVPREIVACGFQRTHFRTDDCLLHLDCKFWSELRTGISFRRFVTFDDDLSDSYQASSERNNRRHGYNLRASCKEVIHINEDNSVVDENETMETSRDPSLESHRDYGVDPRDRVAEKFRKITKDNGQSWLQREAIEGGNDRGRSRMASRDEGRSSAVGQSGDRRASKGGRVKNALAKDPRVRSPRSIAGHAIKVEKLQRKIDETNFPQAVADKALTSTSQPKPEHAGKLIDSVCASRRTGNDRPSSEDCSRENTEGPENSSQEVKAENAETTEEVFTGSPSTSGNVCNRDLKDQNSSTNEDEDATKFLKRTRRTSGEFSGEEPPQKKSTTDDYWTKQFETTFVFGSMSISDSTNRSTCLRCDENITD